MLVCNVRFLAVLTAGISLLAFAGAAQATTPPQASAKVVFSNGGRILSMNADGTDRTVLFGKNRVVSNDGMGAVEPAVSPDGTKIVFAFRRPLGYDSVFDIWMMNSDGSDAHRLLRSNARTRFGDPEFAPSGSILLASFEQSRKWAMARIFILRQSGESGRRLINLLQKRRPWVSWKSFAEPTMSPDGTRILYLLDPGDSGTFFEPSDHMELKVRKLGSGKSRLIEENSLGGAWSPDGTKIVYTQVDQDGYEDFCWSWDYSCYDYSRLRVSKADGSDSSFLTSGVSDERSPSWSSDGRIAFESARGKTRDIADTTEVYSVKPDGKCLTRLTNGSPASIDPSWSAPEGSTSRPVSCGATPPGPYRELKPKPQPGHDNFWLGLSFRNMLLSANTYGDDDSAYTYADCGVIPATRCGRGALVVNIPICAARGYAAAFIGSGAIQYQRGVPVFKSLRPGREDPPFSLLLTGRSMIYLMGGSGIGDRREQNRIEIDGLRRVGEELQSGDLPVPRVPASDVKVMEKVKRIYERTGSVPRTADKLGRGGSFVRTNLRFGREFDKHEFETINCGRKQSSTG